jgi:hypothetical protein
MAASFDDTGFAGGIAACKEITEKTNRHKERIFAFMVMNL